MSDTGTRIRVLAYIEERSIPENSVTVIVDRDPLEATKYVIDVTIELIANVGGKTTWQLLGDYGDGRAYPKFQDAADTILQEYGLKMYLLPESEWVRTANGHIRVSAAVVEFEPNSKPREKIERESAALRLMPQSYLRPRQPESVD